MSLTVQEQVLVVATKNKGKSAEIRELLAGRGFHVLDLGDFGPTPTPSEDADTFEDKAYQKASFYARILGFPALADDSGLVVEALGGRPGIHSARHAGPQATDQERRQAILKEMDGQNDRRAAFVCALVLAVPSGPALTYMGRADGEITLEPQGENGFGYDPIFLDPASGKTFAQLTREEKGRISHRGKALAGLMAEIDKVRVWIDQRLAAARPPHSHPHH
jgi:XTP/dITP diphosphohydrolase